MACRPEKKVCFKCEQWFNEKDAEYCLVCTEWKCSKCGSCGCNITEGELKAVRAIVKTYETWLSENYWFDDEEVDAEFCTMEDGSICHGCGDCEKI